MLALFTTLVDCGVAFAQTTTPGDTGTQVFVGSPTFVNSVPYPTFHFVIAPAYRGALTSATITWGTGSIKDGILIKVLTEPQNGSSFAITHIHKSGTQVTASYPDIYAPSYDQTSGNLSFSRSWDTGQSGDVAFNKSGANSFQWEIDTASHTYVGSYSRTFTQVAALLKNHNLFSNWTARTVLPTKPRVENFAQNFQLENSTK